MQKISAAIFGSVLALAVLVGVAVPASAQSDLKTIKCGTDQVPVSLSINGSNCIDKGTGFEDNVIIVWLSSIIKFLTVGVGLGATAGVVYGGITYLTAQGNSSKTQKGVAIIMNAIIAIGVYALSFALINYLIPGGVLR